MIYIKGGQSVQMSSQPTNQSTSQRWITHLFWKIWRVEIFLYLTVTVVKPVQTTTGRIRKTVQVGAVAI